jgi:hypothetical protein
MALLPVARVLGVDANNGYGTKSMDQNQSCVLPAVFTTSTSTTIVLTDVFETGNETGELAASVLSTENSALDVAESLDI